MTCAPLIYLAGPGVFRPDAAALGELLKGECARWGCEGFWPGDVKAVDDLVPRAVALEIRRGNLARIHDAKAVVGDITPFRGPHCDNGTAFELGYASALSKPLFLYSESPPAHGDLIGRIWSEQTPDGWRDAFAMLVEDFGLTDNLMIAAPYHVERSAIAAIRLAARAARHSEAAA